MTENGSAVAPLRLPARALPVPASVSPEAQAFFRDTRRPPAAFPRPDDIESWRAAVVAYDAAMLAALDVASATVPADIDEMDVGGGRVFRITPHETWISDGCVFLDIHGGAFIMGGGRLCRASGSAIALRRGGCVWTVDYRMPPDYPYPAGLDDCLAAYRALLSQYAPDRIIILGESAGGNLAAAMILRARDEGLPLPGGVVLQTPEVDLTESGDSFNTNLGLDATLTSGMMPINLLYANGRALDHPYLSPLFGDFSLGFPPTLLSAGTRDLFLSNAVRMHWALRAQDIPAQLYLIEAGSHPGFPGAPEQAALEREIDRFVRGIWQGHGRDGDAV